MPFKCVEIMANSSTRTLFICTLQDYTYGLFGYRLFCWNLETENWKHCSKIILKHGSQYEQDMTRQIATKIILKYYFMTWHAKHSATIRLSSFKMHLSSFMCTVQWVHCSNAKCKTCNKHPIQTHSMTLIKLFWNFRPKLKFHEGIMIII